MNLNVQNNNSQSFGMAFKLKGNGAKKLAESFHSYNDSVKAENYFMKDIAKPIQELKSVVTYDGEKVLVQAPNSNKVIEVLDNGKNGHMPWASQDYRTINFHIKPEGAESTSYSVFYGEQQNKIGGISGTLALSSGDELKLLSAKEIAKDLDAQAAKAAAKEYEAAQKNMSIEEKASKLQDMFG